MKRNYIIVASKFREVDACDCPLCGQIALNNKLIAYILFRMLHRWSYKHYGTIAVSLYKQNINGNYDAIIR